jgi:hypothetical protein
MVMCWIKIEENVGELGSVQVLIDLDVLVTFSSGSWSIVADYVGPLGWISVVAVVI